MLVLVLLEVAPVIAVVRVLVGERGTRVEAPLVLAVGTPGAHALLVALVQRLLQRLHADLVGHVVTAVAAIAVARAGVEERVFVVVVAGAHEGGALLLQPLPVGLLEAQVGDPFLLPQDLLVALGDFFPQRDVLPVNLQLRLLPPDQLLLLLAGDALRLLLRLGLVLLARRLLLVRLVGTRGRVGERRRREGRCEDREAHEPGEGCAIQRCAFHGFSRWPAMLLKSPAGVSGRQRANSRRAVGARRHRYVRRRMS